MGAAGGAIVGKFADHQLKAGIRDKIGTALPAGSAGIIAVLADEHLLTYQQALTGAMAKSVVASDKDGLVRGLKSSLEEAMGKFSPDRTRLPIPDPTFGGVDGSHARRVRRPTGRST